MTDNRYPTIGFGELGGAYHRMVAKSWEDHTVYDACRQIGATSFTEQQWHNLMPYPCQSQGLERLDSYSPNGTV